MIDADRLQHLSSNLVRDEHGLWVAQSSPRDLSYPDEGHDVCFAVEDTSYWFSHRNDVIANVVSRYSPSGTFFDVGGGNGFVAQHLQNIGYDVALVEPGRLGAENALARGVRTVIQSTLEGAGFRLASLDAIGVFDVIEHIENDLGFLGVLNEHLKPQGMLYITVPAYKMLWSANDVYAGHYRRYSRSTLSRIVEVSGFQIRYCSYFFSCLAPFVFVFRSLPSRLGVRRSVSATRRKREHSDSGLSGSWLRRCLSKELRRIQQGKILKTGSSCVLVAQKRDA